MIIRQLTLISRLAVVFFGLTASADPVDLSSHARCLDALREVNASVEKYFPATVFSSDRYLARLREGVRYQIENFQTIRAMHGRGELMHVLADNAEQSCWEYVAAYRSRARWFGAFLICLLLLVALLTLRVAMSIVARRRKSKGAIDVSPSASVASPHRNP